MTTLAIHENEAIKLVEAIRNDVRCHAVRLIENFASATARLPEAIALKEALYQLEYAAAQQGYEPLSRVAAVLHDILRYNAIEEFDSDVLQGFNEALRQATEGRADQADPFACELALYKVGLNWLPPVPQWEETEAQNNDEDDSDEE